MPGLRRGAGDGVRHRRLNGFRAANPRQAPGRAQLRGQESAGGTARTEGRGRAGRRPRRLSAQASACAAFSTSSAWPATFTLGQVWATVPSRPMSRVARSMPMYLRPYMLFSTHTP